MPDIKEAVRQQASEDTLRRVVTARVPLIVTDELQSNAWMGLFRQQPDFRIRVSFGKVIKNALKCILSVNSPLSGFKL